MADKAITRVGNQVWNLPLSVINYRLITAYLLFRVNLDKIMHAR